MKKSVFIIIWFCFGVHYTFGQNSCIDITSYDIKANCELNKRLIDITANLKIEKAVNENSVKLLLCSWTIIKSIKSGESVIEYSRKSADNDTLLISIPAQFNNDKMFNLSIDYSLPLDSFDSENKNVVYLNRSTLWYPMQYDDIASMKLDIISPNDYTVFAIGDLINKKTINNNVEYNFENKQNNRYALFIIKSDTFTTTLTRKVDSVNINFYFVSNDTITNNKIINEVCKSFLFYDKFIGNYKYKLFNIVEIPDNRIFFAQSLSTIILIGSPFLNAYKLDYGNWPAHEVAHQWCGNGIYFDSKAKGRFFLEESVNEFFKALYVENTLGNDSLQSLFKSYLDLYSSIDKSKELPILDITNVSTMDNGYVIYQKGPLVVNKLRNSMGSTSYENFIKEIYNNYYGKMLTYDEFIKSLSKYDTKNNFMTMLNNWLSETGYKE